MFRRLIGALAPGLALLLALATAAVADKSFVRDDLASDAVRLESALRAEAGQAAAGRTIQQLKREASALMARGAAREALARLAAALSVEPRDPAAWLAYARAALAVDPKDYRERYGLRERATSAAYAAYQRAASKADEATALALLGEVYALREVWRPALDAYRASLAAADLAQVRATYEDLREKHGFRILDYKVDSDAASPRACFQFSESLAHGKIDFAPFIVLSGSANAAVSAEGNQVCVEGLKHGERYAVVVRQGLPSAVGETLLKNADYDIYVRDRSPQARFTGRNYVLPRTGQEGIPVVSVNTPSLDVEIARIGDRSLLPTVRSDEFLSQLGRSGLEAIANEKGFKVWTGTLAVRNELNKDIVTAFPVTEAVGGTIEPGVYVMTARPAGTAPSNAGDDEALRATQWFVVSDLGLTALSGADGVTVLVRSLASAEPLPGVELKLLARNNEILATRATDAAGAARFDPGLARGTGGLAPGLVVATDAAEYGFLDLGQTAFDLTDRGVAGRPAPGPLDAFLYAERGVYRSGETVFLTALLRDAKGAAIPGLPLTLVVKRPDGVEFKRALVADQGLGGRAFSLPLLSGAQSGTWRVQAFADPKGKAVGETSFLVEDYVPERLEVMLEPKAKALKPGEPAEIAVAARYLFGAPGANLDISGEVRVEEAEADAVPGLEGYTVGLEDEDFESVTAEIEDKSTTNGQGRAVVLAPVPEVSAARPVQAKVSLRVGEEGGRAVERSVTLPILPKTPVLGVKKLFGDLAEGATAAFEIVVAEAGGKRLARADVQWNLYRIDQTYQWYNQDGRWSYEPVKTTRRIADGRLDVTAEAPARLTAPVSWGSYRFEVSATGSPVMAASVLFTVGFVGERSADTPDVLDIKLDKPAYHTGDEIRLRIAPRFAGKATISIIGDRLYEQRLVAVTPEGTTVTVPVGADWGAGAYALVMAHRPLDKAAGRMPGRALGLSWFSIDRAAHELTVALEAPSLMRPRATLNVPVAVGGLAPGEEAYVTLAAVDVGILNLTRYEAPDPGEFYFGQRQLSAEVRDLYGYLIDGMQGTRGAIRSGGDAAASLNGDAPTQAPLARYSGLVKVGADGKAMVSFDIPAFNGTVRLTAVAWAKNRVGGAGADVIVRDPVVLTGTLPRFMNVGDQSRFFVQIDNVEGPSADYTIDLDVRGPVLVAADATHKTLRLAAGGKGSLVIPVTAGGVGTASFDVRLTGPGVDATQTLVLRLQPGTPALVRRSVRALPAGASVTVSNDLLADLLPGTGLVSVSVSPLAALDVPALLAALDRYPYGCTEQTVSRALPLLYVNKLARTEQLALDPDLDRRIAEAIERVLARQDSNGSFGLWSVGGEDVWLDAFATDFLTRARERGFAVGQRAFDLALDRLRNNVANAGEGEQGTSDALAYAIYVLARNGRPVMGDLRYLADTKLTQFKSPLARAQIAAALALLGDRARAGAAFGAAIEGLRGERDDGRSRPDYGSRLRDGAGILTLAAESGIGADPIQKASLVVEDARAASRRTSTQEDAWLVLAAEAVAEDAKSLSLTLDGVPTKGALYRAFTGAELDAKPVTIANAGELATRLVLSVAGNPVTPEPAASQGYGVERSYYKLDGAKVDPNKVKQNERLVVVLKVTENTALFARLLLVDYLPAGFEIDNPKLVENDSIAGLAWLKRDVEPVATEYRDDRFVAAFNRDTDQPAFFSVAYVVRAVAPGRYVHPPAIAEDMYRPDRFGRTAFGSVEVTPAKP